ncbi:MAG: L-2-amino-thiazoline-4-carboxylic acid hydrolase [Treponema sp.]|nr:L-2-amino-thiazoline-4-carboxylic acid hydrolase [Treponema sp.]
MSNSNDTPNPVDEKTEVNRAQIEHRAAWMALFYDEMKKAGADAEGIMRRAIRRCGNYHGEQFKARCADPNNLEDFRKVFIHDLGMRTFDMRPIESDKNNLKVDFHYCALLASWKKLGFDDKTCELLCDMAMDGDRGIAEGMGIKFELGNTIAQGCSECQLHFKSS